MATIRRAKPIYPTASEEAALPLDKAGDAPIEALPGPDISPAPTPSNPKPSGGSGSLGLILAGGLGLAVAVGLVVMATKGKR